MLHYSDDNDNYNIKQLNAFLCVSFAMLFVFALILVMCLYFLLLGIMESDYCVEWWDKCWIKIFYKIVKRTKEDIRENIGEDIEEDIEEDIKEDIEEDIVKNVIQINQH